MIGLNKALRSFSSDRRGNVAIIFALTAIPAMLITGIGVDYAKALSVRTKLQNAADAAALAGANPVLASDSAKVLAASNAFKANARDLLGKMSVGHNVDIDDGVVTVTTSAEVPAAFMSLLPFVGDNAAGAVVSSSFPVSTTSSATAKSSRTMEVSMMLDVTGSMAGQKLVDLKFAAKDLMNIVMAVDDSTTRVALVPFADRVNAGDYTPLVTGLPETYRETKKQCVRWAYRPVKDDKEDDKDNEHGDDDSDDDGKDDDHGDSDSDSEGDDNDNEHGDSDSEGDDNDNEHGDSDSDSEGDDNEHGDSDSDSEGDDNEHGDSDSDSDSEGDDNEHGDSDSDSEGDDNEHGDSDSDSDSEGDDNEHGDSDGDSEGDDEDKGDDEYHDEGVVKDLGNEHGGGYDPEKGKDDDKDDDSEDHGDSDSDDDGNDDEDQGDSDSDDDGKDDEDHGDSDSDDDGKDDEDHGDSDSDDDGNDDEDQGDSDSDDDGKDDEDHGDSDSEDDGDDKDDKKDDEHGDDEKDDSEEKTERYCAEYAQVETGTVKQLISCVTERVSAERYTSAEPAIKQYVGPYLPGQSTTNQYSVDPKCRVPEIKPLTSDINMLRNHVDSFVASGDTAGHLGTAWSWYTVSPQWNNVFPVSSAAKSYGNKDNIKAVVLMTDGDYNTSYGNNSSSAAMARRYCQEMKDAGVIIYTVGFGVPAGSTQRATLNACATSAAHTFFPYDGEQLRQSFNQIGAALATTKNAPRLIN